MKLMIVFGFLIILGFVQNIQAACTTQPALTPSQTWVPYPGCTDPRGNTWYNTGALRCHCNSMCGYICEPNPFAVTTPPQTTTKPTTVSTTTCSAGPIIYVPNQSAPTTICLCQEGTYACYPVTG